MEEERYIGYKIDTKHTYRVYKNETGGRIFYKVQVQKKNYDGTVTKFYKQFKFVQCNPPSDGDIIQIRSAFEDLYTNSKDPYNAISVIVVQDYDLIQNQQKAEENAYNEYNQKIDEVDVDDNFLD